MHEFNFNFTHRVINSTFESELPRFVWFAPSSPPRLVCGLNQKPTVVAKYGQEQCIVYLPFAQSIP